MFTIGDNSDPLFTEEETIKDALIRKDDSYSYIRIEQLVDYHQYQNS